MEALHKQQGSTSLLINTSTSAAAAATENAWVKSVVMGIAAVVIAVNR